MSTDTPQPNRAARRHPQMGRGYVGTTEAAEYLGIGVKSLYRMIAAGEIQAYRLRNKNLRFKIADLDAALTPLPGGAA